MANRKKVISPYKLNFRDILLMAGIFLVTLIFLFHQSFTRQKTGNQLKVTVNGTLYGQYSLDEDNDIEISTEYGTNHLRISSGEAFMEEADCPDHYCVHQGRISHISETIVCLPHRMIAEVTGDKTDTDREVDTIAQ